MLLINEDMVLENAYYAFKSTIHVLSKKNETRHVRLSSSTFNPNDNTFLRTMVSWVIFLSARNGFFTLKWRLVCCFLGDPNTRRQSEDDTWQGTTEMLRPIMHWNAKQKWLQSWNTWTSICKDIKLVLFTLYQFRIGLHRGIFYWCCWFLQEETWTKHCLTSHPQGGDAASSATPPPPSRTAVYMVVEKRIRYGNLQIKLLFICRNCEIWKSWKRRRILALLVLHQHNRNKNTMYEKRCIYKMTYFTGYKVCVPRIYFSISSQIFFKKYKCTKFTQHWIIYMPSL
jgi:hypothetical protein